MSSYSAVEARSDVLAIIPCRTVGRHKTGFKRLGRTAKGNQAIGNLLGERTGLRALACHIDRHVDRTVRQLAVGRDDLDKTAADSDNLRHAAIPETAR